MSKVNTSIKMNDSIKTIESDLIILFGINEAEGKQIKACTGVFGYANKHILLSTLPGIIVSMVEQLEDMQPIDKCMLLAEIAEACSEKENHILRTSDDELITKIKEAVMKEEN